MRSSDKGPIPTTPVHKALNGSGFNVGPGIQLKLRVASHDRRLYEVEGERAEDQAMMEEARRQKGLAPGTSMYIPREALVQRLDDGRTVNPYTNNPYRQPGAVGSYFYATSRALEGSRSDEALRYLPRGRDTQSITASEVDEGQGLIRQLWARLQNARVFEMSSELYAKLHRAGDSDLSHFYYRKHGCYPLDDDNPERTRAVSLEWMNRAPFPSPLSFDHMFIGWGSGAPLPEELFRLHVDYGDLDSLVAVDVLGHLVVGAGEHSRVWEIMFAQDVKGDGYLVPAICYEHGRWHGADTLCSHIVSKAIELINDHTTTVEEHKPGLRMRREARRLNRVQRQRFIPKPYYTVQMRDVTLERVINPEVEDGEKRQLNYRHDRRGHERCYVRRGALPMEPELQSKLERRGYRVYFGRVDQVDADRLAHRRLKPKRPDEWVAVKTRWIGHRVIGDESLPYVPAKRVPDKQKERQA